jgi:ParB family chromosome partitioning protein
MIDMRLIEMGHARALLSLDETLQLQAAREVVRRRLSVRATESLARRLQQSSKKKGSRRIDPDILSLQNRIGETLGARVKIQHQASGKGKLVISYTNSDEFEGILQRLNLSD